VPPILSTKQEALRTFFELEVMPNAQSELQWKSGSFSHFSATPKSISPELPGTNPIMFLLQWLFKAS
jgi:hypothetical protein